MFCLRPIVTAAATLLLTLPVLATAQAEVFEETVQLESRGTLSLRATKGSITMSSWSREEVQIYARIEAPGNVSADYARRAVDATTVDVTGTGRSVSIRSNYDDVPYRSGFWSDRSRSIPSIHYEIRAPRRLDLFIDADRSDTDLRGFDGDIELETDRSVLDAADLSGELHIEIDRGDESRLSGISGAVDLEVDRTNIRILDVRIERDSRIETDRSDIDITLADPPGLSIQATISRRAEFETDLPITLERTDGRTLRGRINGGGPELEIESDRGSIRLRVAR